MTLWYVWFFIRCQCLIIGRIEPLFKPKQLLIGTWLWDYLRLFEIRRLFVEDSLWMRIEMIPVGEFAFKQPDSGFLEEPGKITRDSLAVFAHGLLIFRASGLLQTSTKQFPPVAWILSPAFSFVSYPSLWGVTGIGIVKEHNHLIILRQNSISSYFFFIVVVLSTRKLALLLWRRDRFRCRSTPFVACPSTGRTRCAAFPPRVQQRRQRKNEALQKKVVEKKAGGMSWAKCWWLMFGMGMIVESPTMKTLDKSW